MGRFNSIRSKLVIGIVLACMIPYVFGGIYLKYYMEEWLYEDHFKSTQQLLIQVEALVENALIVRVSETVMMLSENPTVLSADKLKSYVSGPNPSMPSLSETQIGTYFEEIKQTHSNINFVFLGLEDGTYVEHPAFNPISTYDPRTRPWYEETINQGTVFLSDPYISQVSDEMIISVAKEVTLNDGRKGVVGVSVRIDDVTEIVRQVRLGESGYIMLLNANDKILVSPEHKEWLLKTPSEAGLTDLEIAPYAPSRQEIEVSEELHVFDTHASNNGWKIIAIIPKEEIIGKSSQITQILVYIYVFTMMIIAMLVFLVLNQVTKPILGISKTLNQMAVFDLELYDHLEMQTYKKKKDEIGIIARALDNMHSSYSELDTMVNKMNTEIQNIDVNQVIPVRLTLTKDHPFSHVGASINALLERISNYLRQLEQSNNEIQEKNQLLIASEEELVAQIDEIESQREYINFLAYHDPLTNLSNRRRFIEMLSYALENDKFGAVVLLDLDNFKSINDTMGHVYGDKVLVEVANRLMSVINQNIFVSRFGGDEFLILISPLQDRKAAEAEVHRLRRLFDAPILIEDQPVQIAFSMGASVFPEDTQTVDQLIMYADMALYAVKNNSKNNYIFFDASMNEKVVKKLAIEQMIHNALEEDGFMMLYQPQVRVKDGKTEAFEALIRFKAHAISPGEFIPIAEETGQIIEIGRVVVDKVIKQMSAWRAQGLDLRTVSINYSALQLHDEGYLEFLLETLNRYDIEPHYIEIEITENIVMENKALTMTFLTALKDNGIQIAVDDFGTGYSSLSYLTFLPVDKIKIDRSLIIEFLEIGNIRVMESLISLAHSLELKVIAEGVETIDQFKRLRMCQCDTIQGYYFSKPLAPAEIVENYHKNYFSNNLEI